MRSAGYQAGAVEACVCVSLSPVVSKPPPSSGPTFLHLGNYKGEQCEPGLTHYPNVVNVQRLIFTCALQCCCIVPSTSAAPGKNSAVSAADGGDFVNNYHGFSCHRITMITIIIIVIIILIPKKRTLACDNLFIWRKKAYLVLADDFESGLIHAREMTTAAGLGHLPALLIAPISLRTSSLPLFSSVLPPPP